jgi:NADH:ubiquinone oxidoreductase subunit D
MLLKNDNSILINFGPQHPAAHGVLRLIINLKNEIIKNTDPHIGFLHRSSEKLIESKKYNLGLPYMDRLDYVSAIAQEHAYSLLIEKITKNFASKSVSYIRIIFSELTRILNHLLAISCHALDVGAMTPFL